MRDTPAQTQVFFPASRWSSQDSVERLPLTQNSFTDSFRTLIDLLESGAALRRGQEPGVEDKYIVPPATLEALGLSGYQITYVARQCEMYEFDCGGDRCQNDAMEGSYFCAECAGLKLCKTSGLTYQFQGNRWGNVGGLETIPPHPLGFYPYTKRAQFCCDRCRNLWRDTKKRRERQIEVAKLENGERSERYALINNYCNSGASVVLDRATRRVVNRST